MVHPVVLVITVFTNWQVLNKTRSWTRTYGNYSHAERSIELVLALRTVSNFSIDSLGLIMIQFLIIEISILYEVFIVRVVVLSI